MRSKIFLFLLFLLAIKFCKAQEPAVLDTSMFDKNYQSILLGSLNGWIFHEGNDLKWAAKSIETMGWKKFLPNALTGKNADKNGRAEGWFRLPFKLDSSFSNMPVTLQLGRWMAVDVYIDGTHIASLGNTGVNGKPYEEGRPYINLPHIPLSLKPGIVYVMAVHVVDYVAPLNPWKLKSQVQGSFSVSLAGPGSQYKLIDTLQNTYVFFTLSTSVCAVLCLLFWFLYFQNSSEKVLLFIALGMSFFFLQMLCTCVYVLAKEISFLPWNFAFYLLSLFQGLAFYFNTIILTTIFKRRISSIFLPFIMLLSVLPFALNYISVPSYVDPLMQALILVFYAYLVISSWKNLKGAQWAVVAGLIATIIFAVLFGYQQSKYPYTWPFPYCYVLMAGLTLSLPLSLMVYVAMRFKEILNDVQTNAKQVVQLSEEKKELALKQQRILEEEVARQTIELRTSFENLKSTQAQLIQSEKMASLGELTAGIAHEIQNPLNFVNNFSEVNGELIEELQDERLKAEGERDEELQDEIINDIKQNLEKINHHGKRADAIVKGMLQHSKQTSGVKEPTNINALCDEYLRLAYHGMRAKDKSFNAEIQTDFDETVRKINVVPQDIGRVLLNLFNNAFYAVNESPHPLKGSQEYVPTVTVVTKKLNDKIEIKVKDNGNGIPQNIIDKIFQPFFTTKPTGSGTGLGLSLSYDIIKSHGGEIKVNTKEGAGSEFIIQIPITPL